MEDDQLINITDAQFELNPETFQPECVFTGSIKLEPIENHRIRDMSEREIYRMVGEQLMLQIQQHMLKSG